MPDFRSYGGIGPWNFTGQPSKPNYNEGSRIASNDNPVWVDPTGDGSPITPVHNPCGYWTQGPWSEDDNGGGYISAAIASRFKTIGSGRQYSTITSAIAAANSGDILMIYPGTYEEGYIYINKSLSFRGMGSNPDSVYLKAPIGIWHGFVIAGNDLSITIENMKIEALRTWAGALVMRECSPATNVYVNKVNLKAADNGYTVYFGDTVALADFKGNAYITNCTIERGYASLREVGTGSTISTISVQKTRYIGDYSCSSCIRSPSPHDYSNVELNGYGHMYGDLIITDSYLSSFGH